MVTVQTKQSPTVERHGKSVTMGFSPWTPSKNQDFKKHVIVDDGESSCYSSTASMSLSAALSSADTSESQVRRRRRRELDANSIRHRAAAVRPCVEDSISSSGDGRRGEDFLAESRRALRRKYQTLPEAAVCVTPLNEIPYVHGGYAAAAPIMVCDRAWMDGVLRRLMPQAYADAQRLMASSSPVRLMKWAENNPVVAAYGVLRGHPRKTKAPDKDLPRNQSLLDTVQSNTPTTTSPATMISSSSSGESSIPRDVPNLPQQNSESSTQHDCTKEILASATDRFQKPSSRVRTRDPNITAIEWDVFLDPNLVRRVSAAMDAAQKKYVNKRRNGTQPDEDDNVQDTLLAEIEVDRQVARLISRMLLAHGSTSQLVTEALGAVPRYNFSKVAETTRRHEHPVNKSTKHNRSKSSSSSSSVAPVSGIFLEKWLATFAKALQMGQEIAISTNRFKLPGKGEKVHLSLQPNTFAATFDDGSDLDDDDDSSFVGSSSKSLSKRTSFVKPAMCGLLLCLGMDDPNSSQADHASVNSISSSLRTIRQILGAPLSVVLDLKSRRVPPRVWARLVDNLRSRGICVKGIGSFDLKELRAIGNCCSTPVTQFMFFHSAGDLQRACHAGEMRRGDTVLFNAGSLLWQKPNLLEAANMDCCFAPTIEGEDHHMNNKIKDLQDYKGKSSSSRYLVQAFANSKNSSAETLCNSSTLEDYQRHYDLNVGLYVQEFSICEEALEVLIKYVNRNASVINLSMAWGGLNGATVRGVSGDGYWNQRIMGRNWDSYTGPTDTMELTGEDNELVREAIMAVACAQAGTVNDENEMQELGTAIQQGAATCAPPPPIIIPSAAIPRRGEGGCNNCG